MIDTCATRRPARHGRAGVLAAATAVALALTCTLSACATPSGPVAAPVVAPSVDQGLRALLPEAIRARSELRVGTDASYPPMSAFGPDGRTVVGIEPDLGAKIGLVLGLRVTFIATDFGALLTKVRDGDLDLAMSAITDTPQRAQAVDFVNYFVAGTAIVVQRGNPA